MTHAFSRNRMPAPGSELRRRIAAQLPEYLEQRRAAAGLGSTDAGFVDPDAISAFEAMSDFSALEPLEARRAVCALAKAAKGGFPMAGMPMAFHIVLAGTLDEALASPDTLRELGVPVRSARALRRHLDRREIAVDYPGDVVAAQVGLFFEQARLLPLIYGCLRAGGVRAARAAFEDLCDWFSESAEDGMTLIGFAREIGRAAGAVPDHVDDTAVYGAHLSDLDDRREIASLPPSRADGVVWRAFATMLEKGAPTALTLLRRDGHFADALADMGDGSEALVTDMLASAHTAGYGIADLLRTAVWAVGMNVDMDADDPAAWQRMLDELPPIPGRVMKDLLPAVGAFGIYPEFNIEPAYFSSAIEYLLAAADGVTLADLAAFVWYEDLVSDIFNRTPQDMALGVADEAGDTAMADAG